MADVAGEPPPRQLADESQWYTEHTALFLSTLKWALLGATAGLCVGWSTRGFLWSLSASSSLTSRLLPGILRPYFLLPLALPACVWLIRTFAPTARGHGTEAVIAAVHQRSGRVDWQVAPVKLLATVITLAFGGSVGKEGPCAQIGASITSLFADVLRLRDEDRRLVCGVSGTSTIESALAGTAHLFALAFLFKSVGSQEVSDVSGLPVKLAVAVRLDPPPFRVSENRPHRV